MFYFSSWHLLAQSRQRKHQINVRNLFNIFTKDTWRTSVAFTHYSGVSIVDFEKANAGWHCLKSDHQIRSFFWSVFSRIRTEYGEIWSIRTRKNSLFGHFSRSEFCCRYVEENKKRTNIVAKYWWAWLTGRW